MGKKKKAVITGERPMRQFELPTVAEILKVDRKRTPQSIPTEDRRHISHIRFGRISPESYGRSARTKMPVDPDVDTE